MLSDQGRYEEAERSAREAIGRSGASDYLDELHYELGWILAALGKKDEALAEFAWLETGSRDANITASALCKAGDIYIDAKKYKEALANYDTVLDKHQSSRWADYAQYRVGDIFLFTDKLDEAILAYQNVLSNYPASRMREKALFQLGSVYLRKKDYGPAAARFRMMLSEYPDSKARAEADLCLGSALFNAGDHEGAIEASRKAAESGPEKVKEMAAYQIARAYYGMKKDDDAAREFSAFLKQYPGSDLVPDVWFWFGEYYISKGKFEKAGESFNAILKSSAAGDIRERALFALAASKYDEKDLSGSIEKLDQFLKEFPESKVRGKALAKAAAISKSMGDMDRAVWYLKNALTTENNESNAQIQYEIAEAIEAKGMPGEAAEEYLKVPYVYPAGAFWAVRAELKCAQIFERLGKFEDAKRLYEKLAAMDVEESKLARQRIEWIGGRR